MDEQTKKMFGNGHSEMDILVQLSRLKGDTCTIYIHRIKVSIQIQINVGDQTSHDDDIGVYVYNRMSLSLF